VGKGKGGGEKGSRGLAIQEFRKRLQELNAD
jgi:hypothetical protein